jgi:hypothetical protein
MTWLHDSPAINAATIVLAALAVLFAYHGLAGKPTGMARRLLDAALAGVLFGSAAFVYDDRTQLVLSTTIRGLLTIPVAALPTSWPAALFFGTLGFSLGLTPSVRSLVSVAQGQALPASLRVATNAWALLVQSLTFILAAQIAILKLHIFPGFQPPLALIVVLTVLYVVLRRLYRWWRYATLQRLRTELDAVGKQSGDDAVTLPWVGQWGFRLTTILLGGIVFTLPLAVAGLVLWGYLLSLVGWGLIVFAIVLLLVYVALRALQSWAERLPRAALLIIALALVLCAAGLQLSQALTPHS